MSAPAISAGAKLRLKLCTAIVSLAWLLPAAASGQSTWTGASDNDFSNGANWTPAAPGATDSAAIGLGAPTVSTDATVNTVDVSGGTLHVDADLSAAGGTSLSGPGRLEISTGGRLASDVEMSGGNIANSGTLDGDLHMTGGETVNDGTITGTANLDGGKLTNNFVVTDVDVSAAAEFVNNSGATAGDVTNAGTASNAGSVGSLTNTGGSFTNNSGGRITGDTNVIGGTVTNNFVVTYVDVAAAAIFVNNGGATAGDVTNAGTASNAGTIASLTNTGGTFTNNDGGTITGDTVITGGTLTNNFVVTTVDVAAAAIFVNNTGATAGDVTNAGNSSNAGTTASLTNTGGTFTNNDGGTITGDTTVSGGAVVNNFVVTDVDVAAASSFVNNTGATAGEITNAGTVSNAGTIASLTNTGGTFTNNDGGTITGDATVIGGTLVNDGTVGGAIAIGADGTLAGSGEIGGLTVGSGGTFAPGPGIATVAVNGDVTFEKGSTFQVETDASGLSDRLDAAGTVTIDGGTVDVLAGSGTYSLATTYTILTGDSVTGEFDEVNSDLAFLSPILTYDPTSVTLGLYRNDVDFADVTETRNTRATAEAVQSLGSTNSVFLGVLPLNAAGARDAFSQLSGELHASLKSQLLQQSSLAREAVIDRIKGDVPVQQVEGGASFWMTGIAASDRFDSDGNAAAMNGHVAGLFGGIDADVSDHWRIGGMFGYANASAGSDADWDSYSAGVYAAAEWGKLNFTTGAIYSKNDISTERDVAFGTFEDQLHADYRSATRQVFADLGWSEKLGAVTLEPFANLAYINLETDGFGEKGGAAALSANGGTDDVTLTTLGLRWSADIGNADLPATFSGMLGWRHAIGDLTPSSRFAFSTGSPFVIEGVSLPRDTAVLEASLSAQVSKTARVKLSYSGEFAHSFAAHAAKASLVVDF
ncbi:autotransporter outer membrane beta-barrel domain-containing protein [Aliirhizobium smilacinae]|uniref:Autotransporter domain-containing protein n=1 Tax=Aliirhizobium smilacinae TaxID=1395944 RepID=A0A5C4XRD5_9HYPH|nr:autotransporter domain-containing protein [Rhizobium smilacinae]TNM65857.1 autotransporter domain-containing protein [Rhizobium smilacinae]